jgi:hypothetical protein
MMTALEEATASTELRLDGLKGQVVRRKDLGEKCPTSNEKYKKQGWRKVKQYKNVEDAETSTRQRMAG